MKYAERGPSVFWITAPIGHRNLAWVTRVANVAHQKCHYSPTIVNGRQKICLCLKYRFRDHNESDRLEIAKKLAWWAERIFEMPAIISSFSGFVEARKRLGLS